MDWLPLNRQVIRREANGKTIWQPRIGCWLDDREHDGRGLGEGYEGCNEVTLFERLNCSDRLYVFGRCIRTEYAPDVRVEERRLDALTTEKRILTPLGELKTVLKGNTSNYGVMPVKWLVETPEELEIMRYVEEGMTYAFDRAEYDTLYAERAHLGLPAIYLPRVSIQRLYLDLMGVENATYALYDFPEQVEAYFETLEANQRKLLDVVADSPFEWVNYGDNLHCGMLPPALFEKYVLPVYQRRNERLHRAGKFTFAHWDGDCKTLLPYAPETGLDGIEAITPDPQGDVTLAEVERALGKDQFLVDGVAALLFTEQFPVERLLAQAREAMARFEGRLVLGISDELPSNGLLERVVRVGELVAEFNARH